VFRAAPASSLRGWALRCAIRTQAPVGGRRRRRSWSIVQAIPSGCPRNLSAAAKRNLIDARNSQITQPAKLDRSDDDRPQFTPTHRPPLPHNARARAKRPRHSVVSPSAEGNRRRGADVRAEALQTGTTDQPRAPAVLTTAGCPAALELESVYRLHSRSRPLRLCQIALGHPLGRLHLGRVAQIPLGVERGLTA
jgi:hypothetical protein